MNEDSLGGDGAAAGGEVFEGGDVEVAEDGEGEGAGDGGGGHDEGVGDGVFCVGFGAEGGPLVDPEAMLFVDDDEGEIAEGDGLGEKGMGADQNIRTAFRTGVGESVEDGSSLGGGEGAGEEIDFDAAALEHAGDGGEMLLGEDFRGSHEGGLAFGGDGHEHGVEGDDGFARTDIALEEAVHGEGAGEVVGDLGDGLILIFGEGKGEAGTDVAVDGGGVFEEGSGEFAAVVLFQHDRELEHEKFIEAQAAFAFFNVALALLGVGGVDHAVGVGEGGQGLALAIVFGEVVFEEGEGRGEDGGDDGFDGAGGDVFAGRIDGGEAFIALAYG